MSEVIQAAQALQCTQLLSDRPRAALLDGLLSRALSFVYRLRGLERYDAFRLEHVHGMPVLVTPSVFIPQLLRTGAYFAPAASTRASSRQPPRCSTWGRARACARCSRPAMRAGW